MVMKRLLKTTKPLWGRQSGDDFLRMIEEFIEREGGAARVRERLEQHGMQRLATSWVYAGGHEPISGQQLHQLFGTSVLRALAAKADMPPRDLVRQFCRVLPGLVNQRLRTERRTPARPPTPGERREVWTPEHRRAVLGYDDPKVAG